MFPSLSLSMCSVGILEDASKSSLGARLNRELGLRPLELSSSGAAEPGSAPPRLHCRGPRGRTLESQAGDPSPPSPPAASSREPSDLSL